MAFHGQLCLAVYLCLVLKIQGTCNVELFSIGDWGLVNNATTAIGFQMGEYGAKIELQGVLNTGDNFYPDGVHSATDPQWNATWKSLFPNPALDVSWFSVLGNHDYYGNPSAQIDYYQNGADNRWYMPSPYYDVVLTSQDCTGETNFSVHLVFIDTLLLDPTLDEWVHTNNQQKRTEKQMTWILNTLEGSTSDWLIVVGHYPIYSAGLSETNSVLEKQLINLFKKHGVDAYINGHDHTMQHLSIINPHKDGASTQIFCNGNSAKSDSIMTEPTTEEGTDFTREFATVRPGFLTHTIHRNIMRTKFIDFNGTEFYSCAQSRIKKAGEAPPATYGTPGEEPGLAADRSWAHKAKASLLSVLSMAGW